MSITVAKSAGFCFGVKRAVETLEAESSKSPISTLGPIIHNDDVVKKFKTMGVESIDDMSQLNGNSRLAIRTHGVGKDTVTAIESGNIEYMDLTCPFVKKIHKIVSQKKDEGYKIVIVGDKAHPEVIGINGWCDNEGVIVIDESELIGKIASDDKVCVVSQTTMDRKTFEKIINFLKNACNDPLVFDTICSATNERQKEAAHIAKQVDMMVVIGGKHSSNTNKLYSICKEHCNNTIKIENFEDFPQNINIPKKIGITAGASTPSWIIKEVVTKMEEMMNGEFAKEFEEYEKSLITLHTGDIVKGTVMGVAEKGVSIDLGYKSDGFVPAAEVTEDTSADINSIVKIGDVVDVFVVRVNDVEGEVTLSMKKLETMKGQKEIEEAFESKAILEGKVTQVVNGGVIVVAKGVRVFVPVSQASDRFLADPSILVGTTVQFRIIDIKKQGRRSRIVGSVKSVLKEQKEALSAQFWADAEVGKKYEGVVKSITNFGVFVDIGGVDGLIHISELSWSKIKHPSEVVKVGDVVETYIIELDKEKNKISLGFKKAEDNPWNKVKAELEVGSVVDAKIVRIVPFGAFAQIFPGVDGLIHISQVADKRIGKVEDELVIGQHVQAKVVELDLEAQKIGLSIRALLEPEKVEEEAAAEEVAQEVVAEEVAPEAAEEVATPEVEAAAEQTVEE